MKKIKSIALMLVAILSLSILTDVYKRQHMDTSPAASGENVNPQIHRNYDGGDIIVNKEKNIVLSPSEFSILSQKIGKTIITSDGTTLLGADDKAGITEIIEALKYIIENPQIEHSDIKVCFTPDEEVGRGADFFLSLIHI